MPGNEIDSHLNDIEVGETEAIQGSLDGIIYNLWMMKEPDYIMKMMATGGNLIADQTCCSTNRCWMTGGEENVKEFWYKLPFDYHFHYCHAVDNHNNLCHVLPSLEDTWVTQ